jgi:N-methylhydantoinase A
VEQFAQGIVDVANATMEKAIRVISVQRGHDPRDYALVAFGGAGGLHACDLAGALAMPAVLVPRMPGALSALGILRADVGKEFSQTVQLLVGAAGVRGMRGELARAFAVVERRGMREMAAEGFAARAVRAERLLDMRYAGQAFELTVAAAGDFVRAFHAAHEKRYGYADTRRVVEVVNVRTRMIGATAKPSLPRMRAGRSDARAALVDMRKAFFGGEKLATRVYDRTRLRAGNRLAGPAMVMEYSATTVVPPGWMAKVDEYENMLIRRSGDRAIG